MNDDQELVSQETQNEQEDGAERLEVDSTPAPKRGRPKKGETPEALKKRHANVKRGGEFDQRWLPKFNDVRAAVGTAGVYAELLDAIHMIQRSIAYDLTSIQSLDLGTVTQIHDEQWNLPFALKDNGSTQKRTKTHWPCFADAGGKRVVEIITEDVHVTHQPLLDMILDTLTRLIRWAAKNPQNFDWLDIIQAAADKLAAGEDLYTGPVVVEPPPRVGRPPKQPVSAPESVEGVTYFTGSSALQWQYSAEPQLNRSSTRPY